MSAVTRTMSPAVLSIARMARLAVATATPVLVATLKVTVELDWLDTVNTTPGSTAGHTTEDAIEALVM